MVIYYASDIKLYDRRASELSNEELRNIGCHQYKEIDPYTETQTSTYSEDDFLGNGVREHRRDIADAGLLVHPVVHAEAVSGSVGGAHWSSTPVCRNRSRSRSRSRGGGRSGCRNSNCLILSATAALGAICDQLAFATHVSYVGERVRRDPFQRRQPLSQPLGAGDAGVHRRKGLRI